jgi:hypothetical protein
MRLASSLLLSRLVIGAAFAAIASWPVSSAWAQEAEDEEEDDDDGDEPGADDEGEEEEEDEDPKDQPPVTAGGLFTMKTYPVRELYRPLTITERIAQFRVGLGVDVSAQRAFEFYGLSVDGKYGLRDHVTGLYGFTNAYNFRQFAFYGGIEAGLSYDFIDFRSTLRVGRPAFRTVDVNGVIDYEAGGVKVAVDIGFPFRYRATKEIAIIALDTFMSFDFNSIGTEPPAGQPPSGGYNGIKPDLNPSIGIATNPIEPVSIVLFAQLQVIDFNTDADAFVIPATARIQFSPNQRLDLGMDFTFINLKPPDPDGEMGPAEAEAFYENRFVTLYAQFRVGR